jgi:hypothetical protein
MNNQQKSTGETQNSQKKTYDKKIWIVLGIFLIAIIVVIGSLSKKDEEQPKQEQSIAPKTEQKKEPIQEAKETNNKVQELPNYEIAYELKNKRYDGGVNYYVSVPSINLSNDNFKNDIKTIVKQIVKDKGSKISIDFVDNKEVLDLEYKSHYGANTLGRILSKEETDKIGLHLIATFDGNMQTGIYPNTLMFFPATSKDNSKAGKYLETIEFNP